MSFSVRSLLGRVVLANPPQDAAAYSPSVAGGGQPGGALVADVGFGGQTLTAPIKLLADIPRRRTAAIVWCMKDEWTLQFNHHEHWQSMYHFDLAAYASDM
ncbi:arylamine N-acetyltransferase [Klebsiella pneumoniae]|nr:arylamine N-acetyltransferase [Klebsiella pneumoniae]